MLAVTGSVGKTTTKEMLAAGVGATRRCHATRGNLNSLIGLPLTVLSAPEDSEVLVCELGMNHAGEIARMAAACRPALACITNVGTSHIGILGSRENIARAKAEVVSASPPTTAWGPALALTSSGDFTGFIEEGFCRPAGAEVVRVGSGEADAVRAEGVTLDANGCARLTVRCATAGAARSRSRSRAARSWTTSSWRSRSSGAPGSTATLPPRRSRPWSPRACASTCARPPAAPASSTTPTTRRPPRWPSSLDVLASMETAGRRVAVLGEMGELGDEAERLHGYVGAYAAAKGVDLLVLIGDELAGAMAEAALTMGLSEDAVERFSTVEEAVDVIGPVLAPGDLVLVKASRASDWTTS